MEEFRASVRRFYNYVPALARPGAAAVAIIAFAAAVAALTFLALALATWLVRIGFVAGPVVIEALLMGLGLSVLKAALVNRKTLTARYGGEPGAYQRIFLTRILPYVSFVVAALAFIFTSPNLPGLAASTVTLWDGVRYGVRLGAGLSPVGQRWLYSGTQVVAVYLFVAGVLLWARSVLVIGLDRLTMVYTFLPARGPEPQAKVHQAGIYRYLRHPIYAGAVYVAVGGAIGALTPLALILGAVFALFMTSWITVEETELVDRFGDGYRAYRKAVPAFLPRPGHYGMVLRFILGLPLIERPKSAVRTRPGSAVRAKGTAGAKAARARSASEPGTVSPGRRRLSTTAKKGRLGEKPAASTSPGSRSVRRMSAVRPKRSGGKGKK